MAARSSILSSIARGSSYPAHRTCFHGFGIGLIANLVANVGGALGSPFDAVPAKGKQEGVENEVQDFPVMWAATGQWPGLCRATRSVAVAFEKWYGYRSDRSTSGDPRRTCGHWREPMSSGRHRATRPVAPGECSTRTSAPTSGSLSRTDPGSGCSPALLIARNPSPSCLTVLCSGFPRLT